MPAAFSSQLELVWLQTFWNYITASIQSGKTYLPHEQDNIAVAAVHLADSSQQAFQARFGTSAPQGSGGVAPNANAPVPRATFPILSTPAARPSVVAQMDQAVKVIQSATNAALQHKPAPPRP
jgi:hypothetical protein